MNLALEGLVTQCVVGAKVLDLCEFGTKVMETAAAKLYTKKVNGKTIDRGIAFPVCISVNDIVCNFSPLETEETVRSNNNDDTFQVARPKCVRESRFRLFSCCSVAPPPPVQVLNKWVTSLPGTLSIAIGEDGVPRLICRPLHVHDGQGKEKRWIGVPLIRFLDNWSPLPPLVAGGRTGS